MAWTDPEYDYLETTAEIDAARADMEAAARVVRNCPDCEEGFILSETFALGKRYNQAARCHCRKAYDQVARDLSKAARKYKKKTGHDLSGLITPEMKNLSTPYDSPEIPPERRAYWRERWETVMAGFGEIEEGYCEDINASATED